MECGKVDASVMTLQHVLDSREVVKSVKGARRAVGRVLAKTRDIPNPDSLVLRRRHDKVLFRMKLGGHHIVRVTGEDGYAIAGGAVPDTDRLIV